MDKLARSSAKDRRDIFAEAAARRGIRPTIADMQVMLFGESPAFGVVVDELRALENEINSKAAR